MARNGTEQGNARGLSFRAAARELIYSISKAELTRRYAEAATSGQSNG
jgi:hypothetical protein